MTRNRTDTLEVKTAPQSKMQRPPAPKSRWWVWLLIALVLVAGIVIWQRRGSTPQAKTTGDPTARAIVVSTATAKQGSMGINIQALGTVTPVYTVTVTSRVQGQVMNVYYREGQMVRKGDPLLEIDPRPYQAAFTQVEGQLEHDEAVLRKRASIWIAIRAALAETQSRSRQLDDQHRS